MHGTGISIGILAERPVVRNDEPSELDIVVEVNSEQSMPASGGDKHLNLCMVLDASGSMEGHKLETAKSTCIDIYKRLTPHDLFTVVVFASEAEVIVNPGTTRDDVIGKIHAVEVRDRTNLSLGWYLGLLELQTHNTEDHIARLILLSDGQANEGETKTTVLAAESFKARELGITTSTVGIGDDFQEEILEVLAAESGGRFWYIEESHIEDIVKEEFQGALSVVIDKPRVEIRLPHGVKKTKDLNALRRVSEKYLLAPVKSDHRFPFAVRLGFSPQEIGAGPITLEAILYDGAVTLTRAEKTLGLTPYREFVTTNEDPVVRSVVQRYESSVTDEKISKSIRTGRFDLMKKMIVEDMAGLRRARDALVRDRDPLEPGPGISPLTLEWSSCARELEKRETMAFLADLFQSIRSRLTQRAEVKIETFLARWRKMLQYGQHMKRHHAPHDHDEDIQTEFLRGAVAITDELLKELPGDAAVASIKERVQEKLLDYEAIGFVTAVFQESEARMPRDAVMRIASFLSQERHILLSSLARQGHDQAWRRELFARAIELSDTLGSSWPQTDLLSVIKEKLTRKLAD